MTRKGTDECPHALARKLIEACERRKRERQTEEADQ